MSLEYSLQQTQNRFHTRSHRLCCFFASHDAAGSSGLLFQLRLFLPGILEADTYRSSAPPDLSAASDRTRLARRGGRWGRSDTTSISEWLDFLMNTITILTPHYLTWNVNQAGHRHQRPLPSCGALRSSTLKGPFSVQGAEKTCTWSPKPKRYIDIYQCCFFLINQ